MDKKEWKIIDELRDKVQAISEQQQMKKKLANVMYIAVEFAYDKYKDGQNEVNAANGHGYAVIENYKTESGNVVVLGLYRYGAV